MKKIIILIDFKGVGAFLNYCIRVSDVFIKNNDKYQYRIITSFEKIYRNFLSNIEFIGHYFIVITPVNKNFP